VLVQFVLGLGHFERHELGRAGCYFRNAMAASEELGAETTDILYLVQASTEEKNGNLNTAADWFDKALAVHPGYVRATLGSANVQFQRS
jgi:peptidoglycan/xylan/chitin deacetylase (PgdA/CDA1 family)